MSEMNTVQMDQVLTMLRRLSPRERLRVIAQALPETERELDAPAPSPEPVEWDEESLAAAEAEFRQELVRMGLLTEPREPLPPGERKLPKPIEVPGTPLSEIIIAERR